ncbi:hypothetical protein CASFOL_011535 [Castilleja foliolosa]|uniref:RING-type domain-containing protein n=1 Tax=Castilleja foliolosa TaxID=1961234 RepID=A0ABD3DVS7_9LAMI
MALTANPEKLNQFAVTIAFLKGDDNTGEQTRVMVEFVMRYAFYAALIAIFLMVVALIVKLMWHCDGDELGESARPNERTRLLMSKGQDVVVTIYGTNENGSESDNSTSSDDWYDGKICVICYDEPRNCFFIPCGHCVACINCVHKIKNEECKSCPICRGIIDKVRKLRIL